MKKKILTLSFSILSLFSLSSCFFNFWIEEEEEEYQYDYTELPPDKKIEYAELFDQDDIFYMVYCYSPGCQACSSFRNYIVPYFLDHPNLPLYYANVTFVDTLYDNLPDGAYDTSSTIGMSSMDEFYIFATPSLVGFYENIVIFNEWGNSAVQAILDQFN
ncbi:MAG: hypothetical protein LUD22_02695 [Coprobacillus sp.]|nr:hypothetical protein [Coprobacillus sp.]